MITQARLKELLHYDPLTGEFTWLVPTNRRIRVGSVAGCPDGHGAWVIGVDGVNCLAHRLAWLYMTGKWSDPEVDHEDKNASNNIWANLREATHQQNNCNKSKYRRNTSGYKGVSWDKQNKKWVASIMAAGKYKFLGRHDTPQQAHAVYCAAASAEHGQFARTA